MKHQLTPVDTALKELGFPPAHYVENRYSVVDLFPASKRCGVYVLQFAGNGAYAGQAVEVTKRFLQHRKCYTDIRGLSFKPAAPKNLDELEKNVIRALERNRARIRNISLTSFPPIESDFDELMPLALQERWLADLTFSDDGGRRTENPVLREKYRKKFLRFLKLPRADQVCDFLKLYVRTGLPAFVRGEISYWAASCLPSTHHERGVIVRSRINIYWQEVLTVFDDDQTPYVSVHCAAEPLQKWFGPRLRGLTKDHPYVKIYEHRYAPGGEDQTNLVAEGLAKAKRLIQDTRVLAAIRAFNLRLMKKGGCIYARYHCMELADRLVSK